jgi:hypothetical protein
MRFLLITLFLFSTSHAKMDDKEKTVVKQKIKCNMTLKYILLPEEVDNFKDFLTEGMFYGRLRINYFDFDTKSKGIDHYAMGVGGSLIYKSASFKGFSFTSGLYTTQNPWHESDEISSSYRSGKDTLNRYNLATSGDYGNTIFAQNYIQYTKGSSHLKIGRFTMETSLAKSNDTKMIPNTFEGIYSEMRPFSKTKIKMAYITKQKLRDHDSFHHILAYDGSDEPYARWRENDDGAMHQGLTLSKLKEKGVDDKLIIFNVKNRSIKNTTLSANFLTVPNLLSSALMEGSYSIKTPYGKIIPSLRYLKQFDNGAGAIGGANIKNNTIGYKNPNSLSSSLIAGRIDFIKGGKSLRLGYSKISDQADLVSPWRGFPTSGYSRAMGQTNWYANTETFMIRADYNLDKEKLLDGGRIMMRYAKENFDDAKAGVSADVNVLTVDLVKRFKNYPNFITKLRTAFVNQDHKVLNLDNTYKQDPSYKEIRLEMNYLF